MSNASDFFSSGRSGSGNIGADGMPFPPPAAQGFVDFVGSVRTIVIAGTTDSVRIPYDVEDAGVNALGYRRVSAVSGAPSEWIIDWNAIASFTGGTLSLLDDGVYSGNCQVTDDKIYFGFQDVQEGITNRHYSYLVKADLATGAIESVTPITAEPTAINWSNSISGTSRETTFNGDTATATFWWEIDDTEQLIVYYNASTSSETNKGYAKVVYSADLTTVVSEEIFFDTSATIDQVLQYVDYVTEDGKVVVAHNSTVIVIGIPETKQVITFDNSTFLMSSNVLAKLGRSSASTTRTFNCLTQGAVAIARETDSSASASLSNGFKKIVRPFVLRGDLDAWLKEIVFEWSGEIVT